MRGITMDYYCAECKESLVASPFGGCLDNIQIAVMPCKTCLEKAEDKIAKLYEKE